MPAKIEPTMIDVVFLLAVEFTEGMVGDAGPRELVEVKSERTSVAEPARTVG